MELHIDKKIKEYRRKEDLTQEELAKILGVSHQSVSKWEQGDGYPDITLLPVIANHFGITIDELVGNDEIGRKEALDEYRKKFNSQPWIPEEKIALAEEMWRKYPDEWYIAKDLVGALLSDVDHPTERLSRLREVCRIIVDKCPVSYVREHAISAMCTVCDDSELDSWAGYLPSGYSSVHNMDDMLEERYVEKGDYEKSQAMWGLNNLHRVVEFTMRGSRHMGSAERSLAVQQRRLDLIDFLSCGETVNGWLPYRALATLRVAAALFGMGRNEEGYEEMERAATLFEQWFAIPEGTELGLGDEVLLGKITVKRGVWMFVYLPDGTKHRYGKGTFRLVPDQLYHLLTVPSGWEWFDSVRNEDRFQKVVERAKKLMEANTK